jgi:hypothetical protein
MDFWRTTKVILCKSLVVMSTRVCVQSINNKINKSNAASKFMRKPFHPWETRRCLKFWGGKYSRGFLNKTRATHLARLLRFSWNLACRLAILHMVGPDNPTRSLRLRHHTSGALTAPRYISYAISDLCTFLLCTKM